MMNSILQKLVVKIPLYWQSINWFSVCIFPFSFIYALVVTLRTKYYENFHDTYKSDFPIVVVGNPTVGGAGKTPMVIWLANHLISKGLNPVIITRGYKGKHASWPLNITHETTAEECGDEPLMMFKRLNADSLKCPVIASPRRVDSIEYCKKHYPNTNIIISDDGLQHYKMPRDLEIIVIDGKRQLGNQLFFPSGPLRESVRSFNKRVESGAVVIENNSHYHQGNNVSNYHSMALSGQQLINVKNPSLRLSFENNNESSIDKVNAIAAIGNPQRFFDFLENQGYQVNQKAFPDHHHYQKNDLVFDNSDMVIMTEKDAVKCHNIAHDNCWYLPVDAIFSSEFTDIIDRKLNELVLNDKF